MDENAKAISERKSRISLLGQHHKLADVHE